jgi:putative transposase
MCLFGEIRDGAMIVNEVGEMVQAVWNELPVQYEGIETDAFVVMPNHVHGIIVLPYTERSAVPVGAGLRACPESADAEPSNPSALSLPDVVQRFKSYTTTRYRHMLTAEGSSLGGNTLWQRNYYEHVIRHEKELDDVREYILQNPLKWELDRENPAHKT